MAVLKENGQSTELADQVMSTYKAEKSQRYAELKNKLYNGFSTRSTGEESQSMAIGGREIGLCSLVALQKAEGQKLSVVKGMLNQRAIAPSPGCTWRRQPSYDEPERGGSSRA